MSTVAVLMSTYNGEKFIKEQIDSILNQKSVRVTLMIRDDGSSDATQTVCKEYTKKISNVNFYQGENVGVGRSFMDLLKNAPEADYYAFADQDDVWLVDKLERAVKKIESAYSKDGALSSITPILYTSNQILVNENLEKLGMRFLDTPRHDLIQEVVTNKLSGCTMVMNKELRNIMIKNEYLPDNYILDTRLHDTWTVIIACIFGLVLYDEDSGILYRQHQGNVVGAKKKTFRQKINDKYTRFLSKKYKGNRTRLTKYILEKFSAELPQTSIEELKLILHCNSFIGAFSLLKNIKVRKVFCENTFLLFNKCLLGWI